MAKIKTQYVLVGQDKTKSAFASVQRSVGGLQKSAQRAQIAFAGLLGAGAIGGAIKSIADAGLAMERMERGLKFVAGSAEGAAREMKFLRTTAKELGIDLQSAGTAYTKLSAAAKGTALAGQGVRNIFTSVSKASVVMGLTAEQTEGALRALEQMISKGNVQAEELRGQLGERLPGAFSIAARAMGKTTQELNKMLDNGEVLASELLPKLSAELDSLFDSEIDAAANSAQAAFARFSTSIFEVKAAFAESGLLDTLSAMAGHLTTSANAVGGFLTTTLEETANGLRDKIRSLVDQRDSPFVGSARKEHLNTEIIQLARLLELTETKLRIEEKSAGLQYVALLPRQQSKAYLDLFPTEEELQKRATALIRAHATVEQEISRNMARFDFVKHLIPENLHEQIQQGIVAPLTAGIEEVELDVREMGSKMKDLYEVKMSESAKQAARNIQDAFAEFLFDPFDKGVKGMLESFLTAIRRMIANRAAADLFGPNFSLSGFFGGPRALGGPVAAGVPYMVGERGAEMFVPGQSGTIIPNNKLQSGGGVTNIYHFEAGADVATIRAEIIPMLEATKSATLAEARLNRLEGAA